MKIFQKSQTPKKPLNTLSAKRRLSAAPSGPTPSSPVWCCP